MSNYQARHPPSITNFTHSKSLAESSGKQPVILNERRACSQSEAVENDGPFIDALFWAPSGEFLIRSEESLDLGTIDGTAEPRLYSCNSNDQFVSSCLPEFTIDRQLQIFDESSVGLGTSFENSSQIASIGPCSAAVSALTNIPYSSSTSIPPTTEYGSLSQRFKPILNRCMFSYTFALAIAY